MFRRHYRFELLASFNDAVGTPPRYDIKYGGVIEHRSFRPRPGIGYVNAVMAVKEDIKKHYGVDIDPHDLNMLTFERIK